MKPSSYQGCYHKKGQWEKDRQEEEEETGIRWCNWANGNELDSLKVFEAFVDVMSGSTGTSVTREKSLFICPHLHTPTLHRIAQMVKTDWQFFCYHHMTHNSADVCTSNQNSVVTKGIQSKFNHPKGWSIIWPIVYIIVYIQSFIHHKKKEKRKKKKRGLPKVRSLRFNKHTLQAIPHNNPHSAGEN